MAKDRTAVKQIAVGVWDITGNGTLATNAAYGCNTTTAGGGQAGKVILPEGALLTSAYYYVETTVGDDDDDSTGLSLGYAGATAAFVANIAISATGTNGVAAGQWDAGVHQTLIGSPHDEEGADAETQLENSHNIALGMTAITTDVELLLTLANDHAVDAGKFTLYVEYVQTGDLS